MGRGRVMKKKNFRKFKCLTPQDTIKTKKKPIPNRDPLGQISMVYLSSMVITYSM